jgi:hypothetical protein
MLHVKLQGQRGHAAYHGQGIWKSDRRDQIKEKNLPISDASMLQFLRATGTT